MKLKATRRRLGMALGCAFLAGGMSGCRHDPKLMLLTVWRAPVEVETPPEVLSLVVQPEVELPEVPVAAAAERIQPVRRRVRPPTATTSAAGASAAISPPAASAETPEVEPLAIGELTGGGEAAPQTRQQAVDLIESIDRRLKGMSTTLANAHRPQIARIRNFQQQAQRALASGDAEGARTLATKGKLLLDDLLK